MPIRAIKDIYNENDKLIAKKGEVADIIGYDTFRPDLIEVRFGFKRCTELLPTEYEVVE